LADRCQDFFPAAAEKIAAVSDAKDRRTVLCGFNEQWGRFFFFRRNHRQMRRQKTGQLIPFL
jgi:hypothetical protein